MSGGAVAEDLRAGAEQAAQPTNDSGTPEAQLPQELKGWNWGAILLPFVWGPFNRVGAGFGSLMVVMVLPIPVAFQLLGYTALALWMGARGNEWAWRARKWKSADHFRRVQRVWVTWGSVGFSVLGAIGVMVLSANGG